MLISDDYHRGIKGSEIDVNDCFIFTGFVFFHWSLLLWVWCKSFFFFWENNVHVNLYKLSFVYKCIIPMFFPSWVVNVRAECHIWQFLTLKSDACGEFLWRIVLISCNVPWFSDDAFIILICSDCYMSDACGLVG